MIKLELGKARFSKARATSSGSPYRLIGTLHRANLRLYSSDCGTPEAGTGVAATAETTRQSDGANVKSKT